VDWTQWIRHASLTDVGRHRPTNQDAYKASLASKEEVYRERGHIFLVCDGMGAHAAGELASKIAVDTIPLSYLKHPKGGPEVALKAAIADANEAIHARGTKNTDFEGMGTTVAAIVLMPTCALTAHVGDSRVYRVRPKRISQLTRDHSLAWELVARGQLRPDQVESFGATNVITRSLGPDATTKVDVLGPFTIRPGDCFALCSDGLSGPVSNTEIGLLAYYLPPEVACRALVQLANARGGPDNITVQVIKVLQVGDQFQPEAQEPKPPPLWQTLPKAVGRWLLDQRQPIGIALATLGVLYGLVAVILDLPGARPVLATVAVLALALAGEGYFGQFRRPSGTHSLRRRQIHHDMPIGLEAEWLQTIAATCRDHVAHRIEREDTVEAGKLQQRLGKASQDVIDGQIREALHEYVALLLGEDPPTEVDIPTAEATPPPETEPDTPATADTSPESDGTATDA